MRTAKATSTVQTVFALQDVEQLRGDLVTQVFQSLLQLGAVNAARSIAVKAGKDTLPVLVRYCQMLFSVWNMKRKGFTPLCTSTDL